MTDTIRVGFIGAGANTRLHHIPKLQAIEGVEAVAVCNRSMESGQAVADEFGIAKVTTDPEELFADPQIDAICIGTWPYMHRDYAVRALQAGKHTLCEARMAMDAAQGREMLAAAKASGKIAQLVPAPFDLRCGGTIRKLIDEGFIGQPTDVIITALNGFGLDSRRALQWRHRADYSGHNTMTMGIHSEVVQRWLGDTTKVTANAKVYVAKRVDESGAEVDVSVPDSIGVFADMACGARATYLFSSVAPMGIAPGIRVHGTAGVIAWEMGDRMMVAKMGEALAVREPEPELAGAWRVEADFVDSIREGKPVTLTSFEDGVKYMEFTDAVWKSWNEGRAVEVAPL